MVQRRNDKGRQTRDIVKGMMMVSQIAYSMLAPLALGGVLGYWLDRWLGCSPWLMLLFLFAGIAAGYRGVWHLVKGYTKEEPQVVLSTPSKCPDTKAKETEKAFQQWKKERSKEDSGAAHE